MEIKEKLIPVLRFPQFQEEWQEKTMHKILIAFKLGGNYINTETSTNYPLIKMGNLGRGNFKIDKIEYISNDDKINEEDRIEYGDLFFNTRNTLELVGKVAIWRNEIPLAYFNSNLMRLKFENNFFMNYRLNSYQGIKALRRLATGTTSVAAIYTRDLLKLKIIIPNSLEEQQKIANFLTAVDDKLQQLKKKKQLLEQYKKGVMQQLFTQQIRLKDDNGNNYPDWKEYLAKDVFKNHSSKKHNSDLPILAVTQDRGVVKREDIDIKIYSSEESIKSYKVVEPGDFVISLRSFQGGIELSTIKGICSPAYTILKPIVKINSNFFRFYFKKEDFIKRLSSAVIGIRDGKQISFDAFSGIKLKVPIIEEQQKIADFISSIDKKIEVLQTQITQTQAFKKGLLQQMFV